MDGTAGKPENPNIVDSGMRCSSCGKIHEWDPSLDNDTCACGGGIYYVDEDDGAHPFSSEGLGQD